MGLETQGRKNEKKSNRIKVAKAESCHHLNEPSVSRRFVDITARALDFKHLEQQQIPIILSELSEIFKAFSGSQYSSGDNLTVTRGVSRRYVEAKTGKKSFFLSQWMKSAPGVFDFFGIQFGTAAKRAIERKKSQSGRVLSSSEYFDAKMKS